MADWQPRDAVAQFIADNGWTVTRIKIGDGSYKIHGLDADGRWIEVVVHTQWIRRVVREARGNRSLMRFF